MKQKTYLGGVVLVTRAVGTEDINLSDSRLVKTGFSTATESNSRPIKVELTENGIKKETGYNISVADSIISIRVKTPPKTAYKYNEELDLTGSLLEVTKGSGKTDIPITTAMLSAYDKTRLGNQNLTVTYGGKTAPDPIVVNVKDYVTGIKVTPSTIERTVGEELSSVITNNNIQYIVTYAKVGDRPAVPLTTGMVTTNYDKTSTTNQALTITYTDNDNDSFTKGQTFPATLNANFKNTAKSIAITPPSKTVYKHGESLDLTGGTIVITNQDNTLANVTMTTAMIKENGATVNMSPASYDSTNKVTKTLKIEYTKDGVPGTVDYPITIVNDVQSIVVHDPLKTPYNVKEAFDDTTGSVLVTRAVGTPEVVQLNDSRINVDGFSSEAENASLPLTIKFTENTFYKTTTTNVEIKDSIISIKIKTPPKTAYKYNEELDVTGGVLEVTKGSGVTTIPMTAAMLQGYDKTVLGNQQLTVSHGGVEAEDKFTVNVKDYVTGIKVNPATITREVGDTLADLITNNSIKYTVTYAKAGDKSPVTLLESMVSGFNASDTTSKALTVTYKDNDNDSFTKGQTFPATLNANFQNTAKSIKITPPRKTIYKHGESLDLTGGVIEITNQDNTKDYVTMTTAMITEDGSAVNMSPASYDSTNKVTKTLTIEYTKDGVPGTANYPIEIVNDVQSIVVHDPLKTPYNVNESFDNTIGSILVTRAVGTPEAININDSRIDVQGFSSAAENANLPLTIKFTENTFYKTTTTNVEIKDSVISIKVLTPPKTAYKYNEELDLTGALLEVTKGSGKTDIAITSDMLSTYDKTRLGDQPLTVTYGGKTATDPIVVNVKDYVTGIKVNPSTVERVVGEELASLIQANQIKYIVTYAKAGDKSPVDLQVTMVTTTYDKTSKADQPLTITYTDNDNDSFTKGQPFTATLNANFKNTAKTIAIKPPTKTVYKHGEGLSLDGGEIKITNQDGTTSYVTMEPGMIKENGGAVNMSPATYDSTNKVQKTLTIEYTKDGVLGTVDYPITIVNYVTKIEMQDNPKQSYNVNEAEDLTGGSILVTRKARNTRSN